MHNYLFDGRLVIAIRIDAVSEAEARAKIIAAFNCADVTVELYGEPVTFEASLDLLDDGPDLTLAEVDGEAA